MLLFKPQILLWFSRDFFFTFWPRKIYYSLTLDLSTSSAFSWDCFFGDS